MRKFWIVVFIALVSLCVIVVLFPATLYVPLGMVRHEAFFDGKPTSYWSRAIEGEGFLGRDPPKIDVGQTLRDGGKDAVGVLTEMALDPNRNVRSQALVALFYIGPQAKSAAPVLAKIMRKEENSTIFLSASAALAKTDPRVEGEALSAILRDKSHPTQRSWAIATLLDLAPVCPETRPAVQEMLEDPDDGLRIEAIRVLGRMKEPAEPLVAALMAILGTDKVATYGVQSIEALGEFGPAAGPAVPILIKILQDPSTRESGRNFGVPHQPGVIIALGNIGPDAAASVPALRKLLDKTKDAQVRRYILEALPKIDPAARQGTSAER